MIHNSDFATVIVVRQVDYFVRSGHKSWHMFCAAFCHFYKGIYYHDDTKHIADLLQSPLRKKISAKNDKNERKKNTPIQ